MSTQRDTARPSDALPVPEVLLVPLLDVAAMTLADLDSGETPSVLRPLAGFDRRRLTSGPARQQLRRAIDVDERFRKQVIERFREKPEVASALDDWRVASALEHVDDALARADLPLLASALYAARPRGWAFGLGVVCATAERGRTTQELDDAAKATELRIASLDEARRRAELSRDSALADLERLEDELKEERRSRRDRETRATEEVKEAERRRRDTEVSADAAKVAAAAAQARLDREAQRAREAELLVRDLRRELEAQGSAAAALPSATDTVPAPDAGALAQLAARAEELAAAIESLASRARERVAAAPDAAGAEAIATPDADGGAPVGTSGDVVDAPRRTRAPCPPGLSADTAAGIDAMLRTRGVVLVVDGYNVSMAGWGDVSPADQRERLVAALNALHLRVRCDVVLVFDGSDVQGVGVPRRLGVRVVFSDAGEEADPVVVREVSARPKRVPVVVASSDRWVREHAEAEGATVVSSAALLELLRT
jgi:predicted RNA-binding protein with PIN domain